MAGPTSLAPPQVRALFPATRRYAYLNAAASSPLCAPVEEALTAHLREAAEHGDSGFSRWLAQREQVRAQLARLLRASPSEVAFVPSTSFGIHVAGQLLWQLGVREVLTLEQEFPASTLPLLHLGFSLRMVRPRSDGRYALEDLAAAVGPKTGALVASAVQYGSGVRLDLRAAGALCREKNLFFTLNVAQALGQVPIDVGAGVDLLCGNSHKWLMGGFGSGFFYARDALFGATRLPFAGWLSVEDPMRMNNLEGAQVTGRDEGARWFAAQGARFRAEPSALEVGAGPFLPFFGISAALSLIDRVGLPQIEAHNFRLQQHLRERLRALGFRPNAPCEQGEGSGICVFPIDGSLSDAARALFAEGVVVSPRGGGLRISTHVFNDEEDLERLFAALSRLSIRPAPP